MNVVILNDPPYGTERCDNAIRLAQTMSKQAPDMALTVLLMAGAVVGARQGQKTPEGRYKVERMLRRLAGRAWILLCGTCMDARGMTETDVMEGARRSTMDELAGATLAADTVPVF